MSKDFRVVVSDAEYWVSKDKEACIVYSFYRAYLDACRRLGLEPKHIMKKKDEDS